MVDQTISKVDTELHKLNNIKKEKFVDNYQPLFGNISNLCRLVGVSRGTFYNWIKDDKEFALKVQEQEMELNDDLKEVLVKKAGEGSTAELIFYLKMRHPEFKETSQFNQQVNISSEKGNTITFVNFNEPTG